MVKTADKKSAGKRIYIAGPMRGLPNFNRPAFFMAEKLLNEHGYDVVNPAREDYKFGTPEEIANDDKLLERVLSADERNVRNCDAIYLLKGWESRKAQKGNLWQQSAKGLKSTWIASVFGVKKSARKSLVPAAYCAGHLNSFGCPKNCLMDKLSRILL